MIFRSLASLAIRVGGAATSFAFQVLLARLLGPAHLGVYHTANSVAQLIAVLGRRGLDYVLVKHVSIAHGEGRDAAAQALVATVIRGLVFYTSAATLLMMGVAFFVGAQWLDHDDAVPTLMVFLLAAVPLALVAIYGEALKSVGRPALSATVQGLVVSALNLAAIALLGSHIASAAGASWVFLISTVVAAALGAIAWRAAAGRPAPMKQEAKTGDLNKLTLEAWPFYIAAIASTLSGSADLLILSVLGEPEEVGIYAVASRIAVLFTLVSLGVNSVVAPRFAQCASSRDIVELRSLSRKACLMTASAGLPVLLIALLAPVWLLGLFGPEFTSGALVLQLVVAGRFVALASGPLGHLFQMAGRATTERNLAVATVVALAALAVPLTMLYGAPGTAAAAGIAWAGLGVFRIAVVAHLFRSERW